METVDLEEARQLIAKNEVEVIDLRDEEGWVEGHIPGAHRAGDDLEAKLGDIAEDRRLLIVCRDGGESADQAEQLSQGDREAVSLEGGMDAWLSGGMPSQPTDDYEPGPVPVDREGSGEEPAAAERAEDTRDEDSADEDPGTRG
jgi:rhodanese-related sulfurtransferase